MLATYLSLVFGYDTLLFKMKTLYELKSFTILQLLLAISCYRAFAQQPQIAIGAEGFEKGSTAKTLSGGGFIIAGETESFGLQERDMLLIKTDSLGNVLWSKSFGSPDRETVNDVLPMADGGYLLTAEKYQPNKQEGENLSLIKTNAAGEIVWKKIYDEGGNETEGFSLQATPDKSYLIAGMVKGMTMVSDAFFFMRSENQHAYLLKVDANGNKLWSKQFNCNDENISSTAVSAVIANDGNYLVVGNIAKKGRTDKKIEKPANQVNLEEVRTAVVFKVSPKGHIIWAKELMANKIAMGYCVIERKDGGILIAGNTNVTATNIDVFVAALDSKGNLQWSKTFGAGKFESVADVIELNDGSFMLSAMTYSFGNGISDVLLFQIDSKGNLLWSKTIGGANEDYPSKLLRTGNSVTIIGSTASGNSESFDIMLMKVSPNNKTSCLAKDVVIATGSLTFTVSAVNGAKMESVEQGVLPPNMKKPEVVSVTEARRELRIKKLCK